MPKEILFLVEESVDEIVRMAVDAVRCHFDRDDMPSIVRLHVVREEVLAV